MNHIPVRLVIPFTLFQFPACTDDEIVDVCEYNCAFRRRSYEYLLTFVIVELIMRK